MESRIGDHERGRAQRFDRGDGTLRSTSGKPKSKKTMSGSSRIAMAIAPSPISDR
jgi:hypothetical protein